MPILPARYDHPIPFAHPTLTSCELGEFLIQSIPGDDYLIELSTFSLVQNGYIESVRLPC